MSLDGTFTISATATSTKAGAINSRKNTLSKSASSLSLSGITDGEFYSSQSTLAASAADTIDLTGATSDGLDGQVDFTTVHAIYIDNTGTTDLQIDGDFIESHLCGSGDVINIKAGTRMVFLGSASVGWAVTDSTGDDIIVTNLSGSTVGAYDIIVVGSESIGS